MSPKDNNIEELFRSGLEDFELPVNDAMWQSISTQIPHSTAVTTASKAGFFSGSVKIIALSTLALTAVIATTYLVTSGIEETKYKEKQNNIADTNKQIVEKENVDPIKPSTTTIEYKEILDQIADDKSANEKEPESPIAPKSIIKVTPQNNLETKYNSVAQLFLSAPKKSVSSPSTIIENKEAIKPNTSVNNPISSIDVKVEAMKTDQIIASILAMPVGGYAPLEVSFNQQSEFSSINWDFGDGQQSKESKPSHVFEKAGNYTITLTLTDSKGKLYKDTRTIEVLSNSSISNIPNIFTPNNDGVNDTFFITGKNIDEFHLMVMDLKGNLVFSTNNMEEKWDGMSKNGTIVPKGQYVILLIARGADGKVFEFNKSLTVQ